MKTFAFVDFGMCRELFTTELELEQFAPPGSIWIDVTDVEPKPEWGWPWDGTSFSPPPVILPSDEELALLARQERERQLRNVYDPGIMMALRALRIASSPEQTAYAEGKIEELDAYAEALIAIPDQVGFPQTIIWPTAPTK